MGSWPFTHPYAAGADDGIEEIVTGGMVLRCLQTRSGIKFVLTAETGTADLDLVLREIYVLVRAPRAAVILVDRCRDRGLDSPRL